jgi:hypothetical protein
LRELNLGYDLAKSLLRTGFISSLKLSFIARNLFYLKKSLPHVDVESGAGTQPEYAFQESGSMPSTRSIGFSIKARFSE